MEKAEQLAEVNRANGRARAMVNSAGESGVCIDTPDRSVR